MASSLRTILCTTLVGTEWCDEGTLCRNRSSSPGVTGVSGNDKFEGPTLSQGTASGDSSVPNVSWISYEQNVVDIQDIRKWVGKENIPNKYSPIPYWPLNDDHERKVTLTVNFFIVNSRRALGYGVNVSWGSILIRARHNLQSLRDDPSLPSSSESIILRDAERYLWGRVGLKVYAESHPSDSASQNVASTLARAKGASLYDWMADPIYNGVKSILRPVDALSQDVLGKGILSVSPNKPLSAVGGTSWFFRGLDDFHEQDESHWDTAKPPTLMYSKE